MKIFTLFQKKANKSRINIADYRQKLLVEQGRVQFKKLLEKGLGVPVALL